MKYLLGSGFFAGSEEKHVSPWLWLQNLEQHSRPMPERIVIMSVGGSRPKWQFPPRHNLTILDFEGNLGHVHQLIGKQDPAKPHAYCGWSASILALAMIAYNAELDFVYREQSLLAFGDHIGEMDRQLGAGKMIFGSYMQNGQHQMPCAQSLFLIRHDFIPEFIRAYLSFDDDRAATRLPERKFAQLETNFGARHVKRFSFGVDRGRPLPFGERIWYAQKITAAEIVMLQAAKLI